MARQVVLEFKTYEEPESLQKRIEVKAIDPATGVPVASLPRSEMAAWLRSNGYEWVGGTSGVWECRT